MAELLLFPNRSRVFTVRVADDLFAALGPAHRRNATIDGLPVRYLAAGDLCDDEPADLEVVAYAPTAPGCDLLFDTLSGERYEQDQSGIVYCDGEPLWDEPPVGFGVPRTYRYGQLDLGREASFFFLTRRDDGWDCRVRVTAPVLVLVREPEVGIAAIVPAMWLDLASRALDGANWGGADDDGA